MRGGGLEEEKRCKGCVDVTAQPLMGEAMVLHRSPRNDFTSTATPLDPDNPPVPNPKHHPSLPAAASSHWSALGHCSGGREKEWTEREREGERRKEGEKEGLGSSEKGLCKRSTVGQRFLLEAQEGGSPSGRMR